MIAVEFPQNHTPDWFESYTGKQIYPTVPGISPIDINDIAHALSHCCRFAGHCREFYSVATHSMFVYQLVKAHTDNLNTLKFALLHDASEAYIHDITRPMKVSPGMEWYKALEHDWEIIICNRLGIDAAAADRQLVKEADNHALKVEARHLIHSAGAWWRIPETREFPHIIVGTFHYRMSPEQTRDAFLRTWEELNGSD